MPMDFNKEIKKLIEIDGVDLIPVKDSNKAPYASWGEAEPLSPMEFRDELDRRGTSSMAMRLGKFSGGLICIDVDVKNKAGFEATIISDIKNLYPDIWEKFRVEKTPSGGYHFLYRLTENSGGGKINYDEDFPRSANLAERKPTDEELTINPKTKNKAFIEIKAAGGLTQCWPAISYSRIKDGIVVGKKGELDEGEVIEQGICSLTWEEHCCLVSHCISYTEVIRFEKQRTPTKDVYEIYEEGSNPFDEFNKSELGSKILEDFGWTYWKSSGNHIFLRKPGKENRRECDATFNIRDRYYKIHTTTTELESKSYTPSTILCKLRYNDDWKATKEHLVSLGFGKIKRNIESNIIRKSITKHGINSSLELLPKNISEEGKKEFEEQKENIGEKYPYGIFWIESGGIGESYSISREKIYNVSRAMGFRTHKKEPVYITGYIIKEIEKRFFFDFLKQYIVNGFDEKMQIEEKDELLSCYESFLQKNGDFTISRLDVLDVDSLILRSTKKISYKFFKNCYLRISVEGGVEVLSYEQDLSLLVWEKDIKSRDFEVIENNVWEKGLYCTYLNNAISGGFNSYLKKCIGFYVHEYRDEEGYFCIATEECEKSEDGGGSGKNIFWNLLGLSTTFKSVPASMISLSNNLLQSWNGEKIFALGDMPKGFDIVFFKDIITGNANVNKKYINEFSVDIKDMCKIAGSSNFSFNDTDPGIKRRVRAIEFTNYYTILGGVKKAHNNRMFPLDWTSSDYLYFDNAMVECILEFLKANNEIEKENLTLGGWTKQFEEKFSHLLEFIQIHIADWVRIGKVESNFFNAQYGVYCTENEINQKFRASSIKMNKALESYCQKHKIEFKHVGIKWRTDIKEVRGRLFGDEAGGIKEELDEEQENESEYDAPF